MRWKILFLLTAIVLATLTTSTITIKTTAIEKNYYEGDYLTGTITLNLTNEPYDNTLTTNKGDQITLEELLILNGATYTCNPADCSTGYSTLTKTTNINLPLIKGNDTYAGIVLTGKGVSIQKITMNISSTFNKGSEQPLNILFFEQKPWKFSQFSDTYSEKSFGCYNATTKTVGPPIKTASYCETITLKETAAVRTGADVEKLDNKALTMTLYSIEGGTSLGSCTFTPTTQNDCLISAGIGKTFAEGTYHVCVSSNTETNYNIYTETTTPTCGFPLALGPLSSTKDYAIYAQTAYYESANTLKSSDVFTSDLATLADEYVEERYDRNCETGCYLPIKLSGISQTVTLQNLNVQYVANGEDTAEKNLHQLKTEPALLNFSGIIDLETTGFLINTSGTYQMNLGNKELFSQNMNILPTPKVTSITPMMPPAGIPVTFQAGVTYAGNPQDLTYEWNFGDGTITKTVTTKTIEHTYNDLGNYTVTLRAYTKNLSSQQSFLVYAVAPKDAINLTLELKKEELTKLVNSIKALPSWYQEKINTLLNTQDYLYTYERYETEATIATQDTDYLILAEELYTWNIPSSVYSEKTLGLELSLDETLFDLRPIASILKMKSEYLEDYQKTALNWQAGNVESVISSDNIITDTNNTKKVLLTTYTIDIIQKDKNRIGYLVIGLPREELTIDGQTSAITSQGLTVITLEPNTWQNIRFYTENQEGIPLFYTVPDLSTIVIDDIIDTGCNFNQVCEAELGETWKECRSDCKPDTQALYYYIAIGIGALLLYIILQWWYSKFYENHLFDDKTQLYNLMMYIANAKARGLTYFVIEEELRRLGWSREKVSYAIKKSKGINTTRMPEVIPYSKLAANNIQQQALRDPRTTLQQPMPPFMNQQRILPPRIPPTNNQNIPRQPKKYPYS